LSKLDFHRRGAKGAEKSGFSLAVKRNGKRKGAEIERKLTFAFSLPTGPGPKRERGRQRVFAVNLILNDTLSYFSERLQIPSMEQQRSNF